MTPSSVITTSGMKGYYSTGISSQSYNWSSDWVTINEDTKIKITFKDGGEYLITLKEYCLFIAIHGMSPSECTKAEFEEKSFSDKI